MPILDDSGLNMSRNIEAQQWLGDMQYLTALVYSDLAFHMQRLT